MKTSGIITTIILLFIALGTKAQVAQRVSIVIPQLAEIRLKPGSETETRIEFKNANDLDNGITEERASTYQVRANTEWMVSMKASKPFFTSMADENDSELPSTILSVKESNSKDFIALQENGVDLIKGDPGNYSDKNEFSVDYKAVLDNDYSPGTYYMDVLLTVSSL